MITGIGGTFKILKELFKNIRVVTVWCIFMMIFLFMFICIITTLLLFIGACIVSKGRFVIIVSCGGILYIYSNINQTSYYIIQQTSSLRSQRSLSSINATWLLCFRVRKCLLRALAYSKLSSHGSHGYRYPITTNVTK